MTAIQYINGQETAIYEELPYSGLIGPGIQVYRVNTGGSHFYMVCTPAEASARVYQGDGHEWWHTPLQTADGQHIPHRLAEQLAHRDDEEVEGVTEIVVDHYGMADFREAAHEARNAANLDELSRALDDAKTYFDSLSADAQAGLNFEGLLRRHGVDLTELPTFGGDWPEDTQGVWSWDADRLLVGPEFDIVSRDEWAESAAE